jgi:DNA-binding MarR family transcriptional regulator
MVRNRNTVKAPQPGLFLQPYVVGSLVGALIQRVVDGSGITGAEYALTSWLAIVEPATPSRLADDLGLSATTVSAMVERLVRKREVRRVRNPSDGRSYHLELTAKGKTTNTRNAERFVQELRAVRANLDRDPEEILEPLRALEAALRKTIAES